jgi:hypothetical protein
MTLTSNISYQSRAAAAFWSQFLQQIFSELRHLISSRSRNSDTTLSCSQSYHTLSIPVPSVWVTGFEFRTAVPTEPQTQENYNIAQHLTFHFQATGTYGLHWQRCIPFRFTPCGHYSTNRKNVITCLWFIKGKAKQWGPLMVAQWLRYCATNRKVGGSVPDGVNGIFHWHNPSDHTMSLGSTQPLTEMSARSVSWG